MISFDIKFDEKIHKAQYKILLNLIFQKPMRRIKRLLLTSLVFLCLGILVSFDSSASQNLYFYFSIFWLIIAFLMIYTIFLFYNVFNKTIKTLAEKHKKENLLSHYELNDSVIKYSNEVRSIELKWNGLKEYSIIGDNILIFLDDSINAIIIGKNEISVENYFQLIEFIKIKLNYKDIKN